MVYHIITPPLAKLTALRDGDVLLFFCLFVCRRQSVVVGHWLTATRVMQGHVTRPTGVPIFFPVKNTPEIYVSGGGLFVAHINAPHLFNGSKSLLLLRVIKSYLLSLLWFLLLWFLLLLFLLLFR